MNPSTGYHLQSKQVLRSIDLWIGEIVVPKIAGICYNLVGNQLFPNLMILSVAKHAVCHLFGGEWYRKTRAYINNGTSNYTVARAFRLFDTVLREPLSEISGFGRTVLLFLEKNDPFPGILCG